ncbi:MAG: aminotransferase class V-fold PLP-dependent enzyme, partial [Nannocystaceae bacterium]
VGGQRARAVVERGRQQIARALGVGSLQVTLTSGGTEANNLAIFGVARSLQAAGKPAGVVTSPLEHPSVR